MLADLDETLRRLLKDELERHGFEGVDIAFDAPTREWSGQLSKPDREPLPLRHARGRGRCARSSGRATAADGAHVRDAARRWSWSAPTPSRRGRRPSRTSTGCSRRSSAILYAFPTLPQDAPQRPARNGSQRYPIKAPHRPGQGREVRLLERGRRPVQGVAGLRRPALGASPARTLERGPEVRTQTIRTRLRRTRRARCWRCTASAGTVARRDGRAAGATSGSRCPTLGRWTASDADGPLPFDRLPAGHAPAAGAHRRRPRGRRASSTYPAAVSTW